MRSTRNLKATLAELDKRYGEQWHDWYPETLQTALERDDGGITLIDFNRLLAARNLVDLGYFWDDPDVFEASVHAFNWVPLDNRLSIHPSPGQIVYGVSVARAIAEEPEAFSEDICNYIAQVFLEGDYVFLPPGFHLEGAQEVMDRYLEKPALRDAIAAKWETLQEGPLTETLEETPVDVQCARLLAIKKLVELEGLGRQSKENKAIAKLILS